MRHRWSILAALMTLLAISVATLAQGQQTPSCTIFVHPGESIQAAIDKAPAGAVICLGKGTWNENIKITKSVTIRGEGSDNTVISGVNAGYPVVWITAPLVQTQTVSVTLTGFKVQPSWQGALSGCAIWYEHICGYGVLAQGAAQVTIVNLVVSQCGSGIALLGAVRAMIFGSTISQSKVDGIFIAGSAQATISGNRIENNELAGIRCGSQGKVHGSGNRMRDNGIDLVGNLSGTLRMPLVTATERKIVYPDPRFSSLQEAIDALLPGGELVLKAGEYKGGITIAKKLRLAGKTGLPTIIGSKDNPVLSLVEGAQLTVTNLTITGGKYGLRLWADAQATVTDCVISKNSDSGVALSGSAQATITDNLFASNGCGIFSESTGTVTGGGNRMQDNGVDLAGNLSGTLRVPLATATERKIVYPNPRFSSLQAAVDALLPGGELVLNGNEHNNRVNGFTFAYTRGGVTIAKKMRIVVAPGTHVSIRGGGGPAFSLIHGADVEMTGVVINAGEAGLVLGADARAALSDCQIAGIWDYGILLVGSAQLTVTNSKIFRTNGTGVALRNLSCITLSNSTISNNYLYGIDLYDSSHAVISNSTISASGGFGISLGVSATATISKATVSGNHAGGITLFDSARAVISDSSITDNLNDGIRISDSSQATISDSTVSGNVFTGILLSGMAQATIEGNKIIQNGDYGVALYQQPCADTGAVFAGRISGKGNYIPGPEKPDGNSKASVCPQNLAFLTSIQGGELNRSK